MLQSYMRQQCWFCGRFGLPVEEPGWFELEFRSIPGSAPKNLAIPPCNGEAVCADCAGEIGSRLAEVMGNDS